MTYQPNIPLATDLISESQQDINNNFTSIDSAFQVNHIDFNTPGAGKHKWVTFPEQTSNPTTVADEMAVFTKAVSGASQLFVRKESSGDVIQLTSTTPTVASKGSTFLPGGLLIQWAVTAVNGSQAVTFQNAFSAVYAVTLGNYNTTATTQCTFENLTNTGMTLYSTNNNNVHYIAIGKA